ncbi:hypothetical protein VNI00_002658 [Paramarasmius palmivorus]|uniref:C2H2-type domain-containing protein n=1 Tax=Paramarasmius palmivorus TaxID=297713 RepID=A0AAW0E1P3_9AGAR
MAYLSDGRRASEYALAEKLRRIPDDEGTLDLVKEAFRSLGGHEMYDDHTVSPGALEDPGSLSPVEFSSPSSSASSSPTKADDFTTPGHFDGQSERDSDSDTDVEPLDLAQNNEEFEFHNGRVYRSSALQNVSESSDAPYNPYDSARRPQRCENVQKSSSEASSSHHRTLTPPLPRAPTPEAAPSRTAGSSPSLPTHHARSSPTRRAAFLKRKTPELDSDADEEDDLPTDDEYQPSPPLSPLKKGRSVRRTLSKVPVRTLSSVSGSPSKKPRIAPASRNVQVSSSSMLTAAKRSSGEGFDFQCPVCPWKQKNKRMPDFQRHIRTHERPSTNDHSCGWWCKGVPVREQDKYAIPRDAQPYMFGGQLRIGGCQMTFSRRDALKRHLDNPNVTCVGRPTAANDD